jgi:hypothetical protein
LDRLLETRSRVRDGLSATPIVRAALGGQPDLGLYARYLMNAYHYSQHSAKIMALGAARCLDEHPELAAYLLRHAEEERGHHEWALADLEGLQISGDAARASRPTRACAAMVGYVYYTASFANPVGLFGWMYVLEAVGEDLGAVVTRQLTAAPGLAGSLRFVAGHAVSDVGHTHELAEQIEQHVRRAEDWAAVEQVADVVGDLYVRMFQEIGEAP